MALLRAISVLVIMDRWAGNCVQAISNVGRTQPEAVRGISQEDYFIQPYYRESLRINARASVESNQAPHTWELDGKRRSEKWHPTKDNSSMETALQPFQRFTQATFSDGGVISLNRLAEQALERKPSLMRRHKHAKKEDEWKWYTKNEDNIIRGVLMLVSVEYIVFYCCCCSTKTKFVEQPPVEIPAIDEKLNKEAAYLKRSEQFPKPMSSKVIYGIGFWILFISLWNLPLFAVLTYMRGKWHWSVGLILVVVVLVYILFILYSAHRWRTYFAKLPKSQEECPILSNELPFSTLEPTPMSMRPLYMSLLHYLWCMHLIYVPFMVSAGYRVFISHPRAAKKVRSGEAKPNLTIGQSFGMFMLETSAFMWFKKTEETNGVLLGYFSSEHLGPIRTLRLKEGVVDMNNIEIWVDLKARTVIRTSIDGADVKISKVYMLIAFIFTAQGHAWMHAICTWAMQPDAEDAFIQKMSLCSMYFNHLGFDFGLRVAHSDTGREEFMSGGNPRGDQFQDELPYLDEIILLGPFQAAPQDFFTPELAAKLVPYSRFCAFSYLLYEPFMALFEAEAVKICDSPVASFYHTVLHCTDHWMFSQMFNQSPSDLANIIQAVEEACNSGHSENEPLIDYSALEPGFMLILSLSDDFLKPFNVYHRDSPSHIRLFRKVYEIGKQLDPELAYHLQCCIAK